MKKYFILLFLCCVVFHNNSEGTCLDALNKHVQPAYNHSDNGLTVPVSVILTDPTVDFNRASLAAPLFPDSIFDQAELEVATGLSRPRIGYLHEGGVLLENHSYNVSRQVSLIIYFDTTAHFLTSSIPPALVAPGQLVFEFDTVLPFEKKFISIQYQVPPLLNLFGYPLWMTAEVSSLTYDFVTNNNKDSTGAKIMDSYDPNFKSVDPEGFGLPHYVPVSQEEFKYTIDFQNTGTDTAVNITISDTISSYLDPLTIKPGASSHPYSWELLSPGIIKFHFNNVYLPDSSVNEPRSHGFISYSIKAHQGLTVGTNIKNTAHIFFDFNLPVATNTTTNELYSCDSISTLLMPTGTVCGGDTILFIQNPIIPHLSLWYADSLWLSSGDTFIYVTMAAGVHQVVLVAQTPYCNQALTVPVTIIVPDKPQVSQNGFTLISTNASSYQWLLDGIPVPGAQAISYSVTQQGWYQVMITDPYGCKAISDSIYMNYTGIMTQVSHTGYVGPNPFHDELRIQLPFTESSIVQLLTSDGRLIKSVDLKSGQQLLNFRTLDLQPGIYLLKITTNHLVENRVLYKL